MSSGGIPVSLLVGETIAETPVMLTKVCELEILIEGRGNVGRFYSKRCTVLTKLTGPILDIDFVKMRFATKNIPKYYGATAARTYTADKQYKTWKAQSYDWTTRTKKSRSDFMRYFVSNDRKYNWAQARLELTLRDDGVFVIRLYIDRITGRNPFVVELTYTSV